MAQRCLMAMFLPPEQQGFARGGIGRPYEGSPRGFWGIGSRTCFLPSAWGTSLKAQVPWARRGPVGVRILYGCKRGRRHASHALGS